MVYEAVCDYNCLDVHVTHRDHDIRVSHHLISCGQFPARGYKLINTLDVTMSNQFVSRSVEIQTSRRSQPHGRHNWETRSYKRREDRGRGAEEAFEDCFT